MSQSQNYYSDQWARKESGRGNAASGDPYQRSPPSTIASRPDDRGFVPLIPRLVQSEGYQGPSRSSLPVSTRERASPISGYAQHLSPSNQDDYLGLGRPPAMPSQITRLPPHDPVHRTHNLTQGDVQLPRTPSSFQLPQYLVQSRTGHESLQFPPDPSGHAARLSHHNMNTRPHSSPTIDPWDTGYQFSQDQLEHEEKSPIKRSTVTVAGAIGDERRSKRYRGGRDEFDGSVQYLSKPPRNVPEPKERDLPPLPIHLDRVEQDDVLTQVDKRLSQCAFDFVALYRFPIPIEPDKPPVQSSADKGWTEWAYLLKRLATKRRIPSHAIFQGQIKELTTVLDNSLEMRHATKPQPRPLKDDRTVLQFISAGIQVGKMLKDAAAMEYLDKLYQQTEKVIQGRK